MLWYLMVGPRPRGILLACLLCTQPGKHGRHNGGAPADPEMHLLAFAPLVDETNFTADISHELHQGNTGMVLHTS
jgi:hypothetical protein